MKIIFNTSMQEVNKAGRLLTGSSDYGQYFNESSLNIYVLVSPERKSEPDYNNAHIELSW